MLKRWWWFCLLRELSSGTLTVGRAAAWQGGSQGFVPPRSEGGTDFIPKHQPSPLAVWKYLAKMHANHVRKKDLIFLPLLRLVEKASAHVRTVSFLQSLGNEKQIGDSVSSLTWWKIRCTGEHNLRVCKERERPMNTWIWWERPKSSAPQKSLTGSLERENKRSRKYPLWVEMRKE